MVTVVTKTIGTTGDYSLPQLWEDASPANLVTADQLWRGLLQNQTFTALGTVLDVSGTTTDSTRYKELTTDTGASFIDNISAGALRYNESNGAALKRIVGYGSTVTVGEANFRISKIQISATEATTTPLYSSGAGALDINQCIVEGYRNGVIVDIYGTAEVIRNSLVISRASSPSAIIGLGGGAKAHNCTFASIVATATYGYVGIYGGPDLVNVAIFGCTTFNTGSAPVTCTTCYTNASSPPSGCTTVAFNTSTGSGFENITSGTHDLRIKSTSALKDAGTTDSTYAATDILGTARPQGSAYDAGAFELVAAAAFSARYYYDMIGQSRMGS